MEVSLNRGDANVKFKPNNTVSVRQVYDAIARNGYANRDAIITARGRITPSGNGQWKFEVSGSGDAFVLNKAPDAKAQGDVTLKGKLQPPPKGKIPEKIEVLAVDSAMSGAKP